MYRDNILLIVFSEFNLKASNRSLFITVTLNNEALEALFYSVHETLHVVTENKLRVDNISFFFFA